MEKGSEKEREGLTWSSAHSNVDPNCTTAALSPGDSIRKVTILCSGLMASGSQPGTQGPPRGKDNAQFSQRGLNWAGSPLPQADFSRIGSASCSLPHYNKCSSGAGNVPFVSPVLDQCVTYRRSLMNVCHVVQ